MLRTQQYLQLVDITQHDVEIGWRKQSSAGHLDIYWLPIWQDIHECEVWIIRGQDMELLGISSYDLLELIFELLDGFRILLQHIAWLHIVAFIQFLLHSQQNTIFHFLFDFQLFLVVAKLLKCRLGSLVEISRDW